MNSNTVVFYPKRRMTPVRQTVRWLCMVAIAVIVARYSLSEGWRVPVRLASGSMAPTMLGPHYGLTCTDCNHRFACAADAVSPRETVVCPNCFYADNVVQANAYHPGARYLIERATYGLRPPRRWERVVFRCPTDAKTYCVKRVVGLPGETVHLSAGDVYINGQIVRKTIVQQREMAILVHDNRHACQRGDFPPRWRAEGNASKWQPDGRGFFYFDNTTEQRKDVEKGEVDWLGYHHWQRRRKNPDQAEDAPITDDYAYNPSTSRLLNAVTDVMMTCRIKVDGPVTVWFRARTDGQQWDLELRVESDASLRGKLFCDHDAAESKNILLSHVTLTDWREITWSTIDHQICLAIDDQQIFAYPIDPVQTQTTPTPQPLSIGASGGKGVRVQDLRVFRDVYYVQPPRSLSRREIAQEVRLPNDGYFVLGDNSPIADDSRTWTFGPVLPASQIVGRPVAFPW